MRHKGRIALVTGAARGIGYAIAQRLAEEGARVVMVDISKDVHKSAATLKKAKLDVTAIDADISVEAVVKKLVKGVLASHKRIDILVNNAGIAPKHNGVKALVENAELKEWNTVLAVNLTSMFLMSRAVIPSMRKHKWGRIINQSSVGGRTKSDIVSAHYAASKAGVLGFSRVLAEEVAADGIIVNCTSPGRIMTPLAAIAGAAVNEAYRKRIPVQRLGTPEDVAAVTSFLASEDVSFVTGIVIDIAGGSFMP